MGKKHNGEQKWKSTEEEQKKIKEKFYEHNGSFGRRMIYQELKKENITISERRITKIMKSLGLESRYGRKKAKNVYTNKKVAEKYIKQNIFQILHFDIGLPLTNYKIWSIDFTEQKVSGKKVISCGIISVNTKEIVELNINCKNDTDSAVETVLKNMEFQI